MSTAVAQRHAQTEFHTSGIVPLTRPQLIGTLTGLLLAMLLAALDQTIVGTAEPRIIAQLAGFDRYPWVATAYLLTSTISVPIFASLSDAFGRKPFFLLGASAFVVTSVLCGAAGRLPFVPLDGMGQLILFRALQGIGGGMVMGLAFTIIGDIFSPSERGRYQGLFSAVWGLASIFGPTLGGWLTDQVSWRACFLVNLPVGAIAVAAIYLEFPNMRPTKARHHLDWAGFATLIGCVVPLLLALTWATPYGWASPRVVTLLAVSCVMLAAFLFSETRAAAPILPLSLFRNPVIGISSICVFVLGAGMFGVIIYLPLFMQGVLGASPTESGNLLTPMLMGAVIGSMASGQIIARSGRYKPIAVVGSVLVAVGMALLARMDAATARWYVVTSMILTGLGNGLASPVYTIAVQNIAPRHQMGAATSSTVFFRSIGSTVGVALFGTLMLSSYHRHLEGRIPLGTPEQARALVMNPLMLVQMRPSLEASLAAVPQGPELLRGMFDSVAAALVVGLQRIFFWNALIMTTALGLNLALRAEPLKKGMKAPADVALH